MLRVSKTVARWYATGGNAKIRKYVIDENAVFTSKMGDRAGVYQASVIVPQEDGTSREIVMYIGEVGRDGRCFRDRFMEHLKNWIEKATWYTGVTPSEMKAGYKYSIKILALEDDEGKRHALEERFILERKPYLQYSLFEKFHTDYDGIDLCIFYTHRRKAFLIERDGTYDNESTDLFVNNLFEIEKNVALGKYKKAKPKEEVVKLVTKEMPKGSDICMAIKKAVDRNLGIDTGRGCNYSYLVRIVAAALENKYCEEYVI